MAYTIDSLIEKFPHLTGKKQSILSSFSEDDGNSEIDELEVDDTGEVVAEGHRCTKEGCNCVGGWWQKVSSRVYGPTYTVKKY